MTFFKTYDVIFDSKMGTSIEAQKVKKGENAIKPNAHTLKRIPNFQRKNKSNLSLVYIYHPIFW